MSFTLGIFTEVTRRSPHAWRHLGCIPGKVGKLIPVGKNKKHGDLTTWRMRDYHACLSVILESYIKVQKKHVNGQLWCFNYDGCVQSESESYLHFSCMTVNGDIQGHQSHCMWHKSNNISPVSHWCDCPREQCMIPGHVCTQFNMQTIVCEQENYLSNPTSLSLAVLKGKCIVSGVTNAWKDVDFGHGNIYCKLKVAHTLCKM